ncbi:phage tail tape measure protein [Paraburkholderia sp. D15]|uniref:phage tail tape measure protein n=1 Tax=Paraburkholderia sp. D15 TaxID=2880218 RepID=UPI002478D3F7|nr:phage tail tape measure protein [Paraburkholderia sp. D15]WGS53585.1 phage tail tape measure protein [Paraburkholderia sp. D15]
MINAYAIGVTATLEDNVTARLMGIVDWSDKANASLLELTSTLRKLSGAGISLSRNLDKAAAASTALGDTSGGLTRASYVLDTMAASSADLARNMAAARAEGNGLGSGMRPGGGGGGGGNDGAPGGASRESGSGRVATGAGVATAGMLYGAYENARLADTNVKSVATAQLPFSEWQSSIEDLRSREMEYASKYAWATGGHIEPFAESLLDGARLMRTLSADKQKEMLDHAMPYIALEAKLKGVSMGESTDAFIGLSHMAGAYDPKDAEPLWESMLQASLTSHASLGQIARAASYALPSLHAAGANSSDVMLLVATMMQGGIMNTKSGTWLNAMASNALPNTLGSGLFSNKKQNEALHELGLYKGNKSQFYNNGSMDLMKEVAILAADREKMEPLKFNALLKMAFGTQGQRGASFFSEDTTIANLHALADLKNQSQPPMDIGRMIGQVSTVGLADQTIANANITLMNGTATLMGPINSALKGTGSFFEKTADFTKDHPVAGAALDFGMLFSAAVLGMGAWSGAKGASTMLQKGVTGLAKNLTSGAGSLLSRAATMLTGEEIGLAALASAGGVVAISSLLAAGIGYMIQRGLDAAASKMTPDQQNTFYQGVAGGVPLTFGNKVTEPVAPYGKVGEWIHNHFYVDSQEVATKMIPPKSTGPTGMNPSASPFSPGMGMY